MSQKKSGRQIQREYTQNLMNSDRPNNQVHGLLRDLGAYDQTHKKKGLRFRIILFLAKILARLYGWTTEDIEEALEEGRKHER